VAFVRWSKQAGDVWVARVPPDAMFTLRVEPKGDGRWAWRVFSGTTPNPMASGVAASLNAAKNVTEQLAKRAGAG
jgi:hypothetical protein